ncbi:hypothetical protein [Exiguobacterium sp. HVEsp1]|uniref:hypothetical protein n=1 Tax=Exiguobacterium sp. HVEsp1 TaxID=1934003 RepID=UPI00117B1205|nr:hypothetical protein [Exiguobacterium sp. HVEsp1]
MRTIDGNVTITGDTSGDIDLQNLTITGNLTVNTPNATVNNSATVNGTIDIQDVKDGTWNERTNGNTIVVNDTTGIRVVIAENIKVNSLTLNQPTTLEVSSGATFEKPVVVVKPSTIVSSQPIQLQPEQGVDVTLKSSTEDKGVVVSGSGDAIDSSESIEKARLENLTNLLTEATKYNYDPTLDFKSILTLSVNEKAITLDLTEDVVAISNYWEALKKNEATKNEPVEYAAGRYALNTLARYMGALERTAGSSVEEIVYNGVSYTWDAKGTLKGNNWKDEEGATLMSVVFPNIEQSLEFKLVDDQGFEIDITFNVEWPELTSNTENPTN